jgi:hypothetical protein
MASTTPTYYDVLRVDRAASPDGLRSAYRRLAQKYHPDKMPGNANAARAMAAINAAYEVLSDPHQRAEHDRWIVRSSRPAPLSRDAASAGRTVAWPWYLLAATLFISMGSVGTAVYFTTMPARATVPTPSKVKAPDLQLAKAPVKA